MKKEKPSASEIRDQFGYDPETGELIRKNLRAKNMRPETGSVSRGGYVIVGVNGTHEMLHRLVWVWVHGEWPSKQIEHINGDKSDNRLANLRLRNAAPLEELTLDKAKEWLRYDKDAGKFFWLKTTRATRAGDEAGHVRKNGYRVVMVGGISSYAHRLVWLFETGDWPKNWIDHKNGDRDDNRIENLRDVTPSRNSHNTKKLGPNNTTGFRGVAKYMDKYISQIMVEGRREAIGLHATPEEAHEAYLKRYVELFGSEPDNENEMAYYRKSRAKKAGEI